MTLLKIFKTLTLGLFLSAMATGCVKGPKGDTGSSGRIVSTIGCEDRIVGGLLDGIYVEYDAVLTASGDVYATATIIDDVSSRFQASGTSFYSAHQNGAQTASVLITADVVGASDEGLWEISLNRSSLITTVEYMDSDPGSDFIGQFDPSACTVQYY